MSVGTGGCGSSRATCCLQMASSSSVHTPCVWTHHPQSISENDSSVRRSGSTAGLAPENVLHATPASAGISSQKASATASVNGSGPSTSLASCKNPSKPFTSRSESSSIAQMSHREDSSATSPQQAGRDDFDRGG